MLIIIQIIFAVLTFLFLWKLVGINKSSGYSNKKIYKGLPNILHIANLTLCWIPVLGIVVTITVIIISWCVEDTELRRDRKLNKFLFGLSLSD